MKKTTRFLRGSGGHQESVLPLNFSRAWHLGTNSYFGGKSISRRPLLNTLISRIKYTALIKVSVKSMALGTSSQTLWWKGGERDVIDASLSSGDDR